MSFKLETNKAFCRKNDSEWYRLGESVCISRDDRYSSRTKLINKVGYELLMF